MPKIRIAATFALIILGIQIEQSSILSAQDEPPATLADSPFQVMQDAVSRVQARSLESGTAKNLPVNKPPILRFGDATRKTIDGVVWSLGEGRPKAMVAMELVTKDFEPTVLSYEFLCLTDDKIVVTAGPGWTWTPRSSALKFKTLPASIPVSPSKLVRQRQIKQLAQQFSASEFHEGEDYVLRLLTNPIVRYVIDDAKGDMGAIFAFSNGTNPEVLLFIESTESRWQYGFVRMCGASPTARLDGEVVWSEPSMTELGSGWDRAYTGDVHPVNVTAK
ncbi:hypothetical protein [Rhodopirellula sp. MGV]|uniref:hypothetical protein n=1 Tax=Rhodopirellula sp. MGV TaxID=2023130 RepID=UPI00117A2249|nr:hypothetical protein [Rhodopirellula sp. MGV]